MIIFIFATAACNLSCTYCGGEPEDLGMPIKPAYEPDELVKYFEGVEDLTLVLYGGEPLVNMRFCMKLMDTLPLARFILQSNCTLLHKLPTRHLHRLDTILCSIDGVEATFDAYRGSGTYASVLKNVADARARGFKGKIVARGACSLRASIDTDAWHLATIAGEGERPVFDAVYWQLDANWDAEMNDRWGAVAWDEQGNRVDLESDSESESEDESSSSSSSSEGCGCGCECDSTESAAPAPREAPPGTLLGFPGFIARSYLPGMERLWQRWLADLEAGVVRNIVPFTGICRSVLYGENHTARDGIWCGCGHRAFSICTDARIQICPVGFDDSQNGGWNFLGTIDTTPPARLAAKSPKLKAPCTPETCPTYTHCGGRCLFANQTQNWKKDGFDLVCSTVRQLVALAERDGDRVMAAVEGLDETAREAFFWRAELDSLEVIP